MITIEPGTILKSRYMITEQLGKGGMGEVFLAKDETLDTNVAVKANHNLASHTSAQFIREARLLASLKHPNLPRVIDYFTDDDSQYLVMDYISGENLKEIVESKKKNTFEQIIKWSIQLGDALTYLHVQNPPIYHRDVKPANIKLTESNEVVLVDFGIAKTGDASQETQTGAWAFSPGFAPPEQVSGMRTGPYSDQFSLAATIYFLLAGKPPADSAKRLMGEEEYVPLINSIPSLPAHFSAALDRALSIKPEARFASVADFIQALTNPNTVFATTAIDQKTVMTPSRVEPPHIVTAPAIPPYLDGQPQLRRKSSTLWMILGVLIVLGIATGGYVALKSLGIIGKTPNTILPTLTLQTIVMPTGTANSELLPANPVSLPAPENGPTSTAEAPGFTPIGWGGKVAFVSDRQGDGFKQVWVMQVGLDANNNLVTSNLQQLTFSPNNKSNPSWSPDGTKIIYSGLSTDFSVNGTPFADDIWMLDLANPDQEPVDLSRRAGDDRYAAWSPNNKFIAFTSYYREDKTPQQILMNTDGSNQTLLSTLGFSDTYSTWSPNGDWLLYVFSTGNIKVLQMRYQSDFINNVRKFDQTSNEGRLGNVMEPAISFDGANIIYTQSIDNKTNICSAVFADRGRTVTQLTDTGQDFSPCWSPDGKWILFTSERDGDPEIYIMDSSGGKLTNLSMMPSIDTNPSWQPMKPN